MESLAPLFPWQIQEWQQLATLALQQRLPHALLFTGPQGIGKNSFVTALAHLLLCFNPLAGKACTQCKSCQLLQADTHPDLQLLRSTDEQPHIKIEQIRDLLYFGSLSKQISQRKVIILDKAEAMNHAAANAFLKTLEEPNSGTHILLISQQTHLLPATIRSRCQTIRLPVPSNLEALSWLQTQLQHDPTIAFLLKQAGSPLLALEYAKNPEYLTQYDRFISTLLDIAANKVDPISAVATWAKHPPTTLLNWLRLLLLDILRIHNRAPSDILLNDKITAPLHALATTMNVFAIWQLVDKLNQTVQYLHEKINLNAVLLLENLLCDWYFLSNSR